MALPKNQTAKSRAEGSITRYLTAFTVYLTEDLEAKVLLNPDLPTGVTVLRTATSHDFDVASLWIDKYRGKKD